MISYFKRVFKVCLHVPKYSLSPMLFCIRVHTDTPNFCLLVKWMTDPFALKFYSLVKNNIGPNIGNGLNFVTCDRSVRSK